MRWKLTWGRIYRVGKLRLALSLLTFLASNMLYLRAAELHLRYFIFFDRGQNPDYHRNLARLFFATTSFLQYALKLETSLEIDLIYATDYILQIIVSAGFALLKMLNSFFAAHIDLEQGKLLFNWVVSALRRMSVKGNDRAARLADVLAQLWRAGGVNKGAIGEGEDSSLRLKVRCRMSMSHVFDSVWRWREDLEGKRRGGPGFKFAYSWTVGS
jgi:hypothetical protein